MSGHVVSGNSEETRPDSSSIPGPSQDRVSRVGINYIPTGIPVVDIADQLGSTGVTYEEEFGKIKNYIKQTRSTIGPASPVLYVHHVRQLYVQAKRIVADKTLTPYKKCVFLFQIFDALVLVYKCLSFVYSNKYGARSVFGYSDSALKNLLSRIEAFARQVAVCVHDAYSLTALNDIVATTQQSLSQVQSERDMLEFFRNASGGSGMAYAKSGGGADLPRGLEVYKDPYNEVATLVERLYATNSDKSYIREFHDCMFLIAKGNSPCTLSSALETRLSDKDRNIVLFEANGDRLFASSMCASAIGFLRKKLREIGATDAERSNNNNNNNNTARTCTTNNDEIQTYRVNYGRIFSKYRGESERNFDEMMDWIKNKVRGSDIFRIFWFPDIENLMSPRTSNDQEHIAAIKNSMLQHMDVFNKDRTLRSFLLLFNSSEGPLDSAFSRRLETVIKTPTDPLTDLTVATQVVGAELARYHINLTDELVNQVAIRVGAFNPQSSRVGGFAQVQAILRDMFVNQKLMLSNDVRAVEVKKLPADTIHTVLGRYTAGDSRDTLYDLNESPMLATSIGTIAFGPATRCAGLFADLSFTIKYNSIVPGDPKNIDKQTATQTVFIHDI